MPVIGDWSAEQRKAYNDLLVDVTAIRTAFLAFTAKLDTDAVAQNAAVTSSQLDVDYASVLDPAALTATTVTRS